MRRPIRPAPALAALALALAGCSSDGNIVRDAAMAAGITGGEPKPAPDFVTRTRPASADYVPVGTSAPRRNTRAKSAEAVADAESELNALRARNEARGAAARRAAQTPAPAPAGSRAPRS
jgi:hypothetical protein